MIIYRCKKDNIDTETSVCPVCHGRCEVDETVIYWCDNCRVPFLHLYLIIFFPTTTQISLDQLSKNNRFPKTLWH